MSSRLKKEFLRLLRVDEEFRYAVAGLLGLEEILKRLDRNEAELVKLREDMNKLREDMIGLREDMIGLREETNRLREDMNSLRGDMIRGFELLERHLSAIGARWGLMAESAFREGLRGVLERELGLSISRWTAKDERGIVYGYPSEVEVDMAVRDRRIILIEVKSHVRPSDVAEFARKAQLYREVEGRPPDRMIIVTPYAEEEALEAAKRLNIETYTKV